MVVGLIVYLAEVVFSLFLLNLLIDFLFDVDIAGWIVNRVRRGERLRVSANARGVRISTEKRKSPKSPPKMVRDPEGRFSRKAPSTLEDPHDPEELARIEAELDAEIRRKDAR